MTTEEEKAVVIKLVEAYEMFMRLYPDKSDNELTKFVAGIDACQDVIRGRVAKRADPKFWL